MQLRFSPFPQLFAERLLLRQLNFEDAEKIFELRSNDLVNQYLNRPKATSIEDATAFIEKINSGIAADQCIYWAICLHNRPGLIGTICLWNFSGEESKAETGYELLPQFHGRGMMQEAFAKVLEFAFQTLQLHSIDAWTVHQNERSIKVLERNRFKRNPDLENKIDRAAEGADTIIYSLSQKDYLNGRT